MLTLEYKIKKFEELNKAAEEGGGQARIDKHHAAGKKTARERINENTFISFRLYNLPGIPRAGPVTYVNIETNRITHFTVMVLELLAMLIGSYK